MTACDDSEVAVWNSETGSNVTRFYKAHDNEEITALSKELSNYYDGNSFFCSRN